MRNSAILLSSRYALPDALVSNLDQGSHVYGHAQPSPDELGGVLDFVDWQDRPHKSDRFLGRWTLLYFGYARCTGSCTTAVPLIVKTARTLRAQGLAANAAFVDIDAPPIGISRIYGAGEQPMQHDPNWEKRRAMRALAITHGEELIVLSGSRRQLAEAGIAYHVLREHIPPRDGESGHSINHSSMIYFIGRDTLVAGYGYHDADAETLARTIVALESAPRRQMDSAIYNRRNAGLGCSPTTPAPRLSRLNQGARSR